MLNSFTHKAIQWEMVKRVLWLYVTGHRLVVYDAALLFEMGASGMMGAVIVVCCDERLQIERLMTRDKMDEEGAKRMLAMQMKQSEKKALADIVVDNSFSKEETLRQLDDALRQLTPSRLTTYLYLFVPVLAVFSVGLRVAKMFFGRKPQQAQR